MVSQFKLHLVNSQAVNVELIDLAGNSVETRSMARNCRWRSAMFSLGISWYHDALDQPKIQAQLVCSAIMARAPLVVQKALLTGQVLSVI